MSNNMQEIGIRFGALGPSIGTQLKQQGFKFDVQKAKEFQKLREYITYLMFADILNDSQKDKAFDKLFSQIKKHIRSKNHHNQLKNK